MAKLWEAMNESFCNQHHYSFIKPYFQHFLILYLTCIRMSHWRRLATEGAEFWISCKRLKLLRKAGRLQLILQYSMNLRKGPKDPYLHSLIFIIKFIRCEKATKFNSFRPSQNIWTLQGRRNKFFPCKPTAIILL